MVEVVFVDLQSTKCSHDQRHLTLNQFQAFHVRILCYFSVIIDMIIKAIERQVLDVRLAFNLSRHVGPELSFSSEAHVSSSV